MSNPIRVLCVDDSEDLAEILCMLIDRSPGLMSVGSIHRADELLDVVAERKADVALLDLTMPGRSPIDALRQLVAVGSPCRVIVMSGHDDQETVDLAFQAGAWGFVSKHGDPHDIIKSVQTVGSEPR